MLKTLLSAFLMTLLIAEPVSADNVEGCGALPQQILSGKGLYVGEMHGTREVPQLVLCLTTQALENVDGHVVVSLELPSNAADFSNDFWKGQDGRASLAMRQLLTDLLRLAEKESRLKVRFHSECTISPEDMANINRVINKCYAEHIQTHAREGFLLAYGGNFHAGRQMTDYPTTADYLLSDIKNVDVVSVGGGVYWNFAQKSIWPKSELMKMSGFVSSPIKNFDYYYVIPVFSASPPVHCETCKRDPD